MKSLHILVERYIYISKIVLWLDILSFNDRSTVVYMFMFTILSLRLKLQLINNEITIIYRYQIFK